MRSLTLHNAHTNERATIVYKRDGRLVPSGVTELNRFLRDWRRNEPTKMDPKLFDMLWEVYRQADGRRAITVICGYRSRETNEMLRRRGRGVARNSMHVKGQAIDFYIPGVDLAKMRAIGLRMQAGGVGFYPSSGSPFIHMDTGSVRHWPKMSRKQLVKVFPEGKTLHVPSDGKPLPGYAQALAAYKVRKARGIAVASVGTVPDRTIAALSPEDLPLPRVAPGREPGPMPAAPTLVAVAADTGAAEARSLLSYPPQARVINGSRFSERFAAEQIDDAANTRRVAFETAHHPTTSAPVDLIAALVERHGGTIPAPVSRSASLPIQPTAVVATVDVGVDLRRPLRADAITTAVLRGNGDRLDEPVPTVLAFASATAAPRTADVTGSVATSDVPTPQTNPVRLVDLAPVAASVAEPNASAVYEKLLPANLTLTKLDTRSLRLWIATPSTREKRYALLTLPAFDQTPELFATPDAALATGFEADTAERLRTDRFDSAAETPDIVDLTANQIVASR